MFQGEVDYEIGSTFVETGYQSTYPGIFSFIQRAWNSANNYNDGSPAV